MTLILTCFVSGNDGVGGLVGVNGGNISNCYSTGTVSNAPNSDYSRVGGLVGENYGSISNCYSTSAVSGECVGGLVGENDGSTINCYSTGSVSGFGYVGGLVGLNRYSISNCYSTGAVSGSGYVGGLVGRNSGSSYCCGMDGGTVSGGFWDVNTSGQTTSDGGTGMTTAQMKTVSTFTSAGWDFTNGDGNPTVWFMPIGGYLILSWQTGASTSTVDVPNVVGMTATDANTVIVDANLVVGTATTAYSDSVAEGNLISQSPPAGTVVAAGWAVNYVMSLGNKPAVPNIVGMAASDANTAIVDASLVVGTVTTKYCKTVDAGKVMSQSPAAGTVVMIGSKVKYLRSLGKKPTVPNVVGMAASDANTAIVEANLVVGTVTTKYSKTVDAGKVISQSPPAGTVVTIGSKVKYVRSLGKKPTVPNIVGMAASDANTAIVEANLVVGTVTTKYSNTVNAGKVIKQSPAAGKAVAIGSKVKYVRSLGKKPIVPNIVGMTASDANTAIVEANLVVGTVTTKYSNTVDAGKVISQSPAAGKAVAIGSKVKYVISLGKQ